MPPIDWTEGRQVPLPPEPEPPADPLRADRMAANRGRHWQRQVGGVW
jgi:hypothetical protein